LREEMTRKERYKPSETHRRNISKAMMGKKHSDKTIQKMKESHKNPSLETRRKISETKKGHICSEETKKKIGNANRGRKHSEESIEKMRVAKHAKHAKFSEETKIKMSESHWKGGRKVSLERERNKRKNDVKYQLNRRISRGIRKCLK